MAHSRRQFLRVSVLGLGGADRRLAAGGLRWRGPSRGAGQAGRDEARRDQAAEAASQPRRRPQRRRPSRAGLRSPAEAAEASRPRPPLAASRAAARSSC